MTEEIVQIQRCIDSCPSKLTEHSAKEWLLTGQRSVAAMLLRLVNNDTPLQVSKMLLECAGRTLKAVQNSGGPVQQLWEKLVQVWASLPRVDEKALETKRGQVTAAARRSSPTSHHIVATLSNDLNACLTDAPFNVHVLYRGCSTLWLELSGAKFPPSMPANLIQDADFWENRSHSLPYRRRVLGDFLASNIADRLTDLTELVGSAAQALSQVVPQPGLRALLEKALSSIWYVQDAEDRQCGWVLIQVCMAGTRDADVHKALLPEDVPSPKATELPFKLPAFDQETHEPALTVLEALKWLLGKLKEQMRTQEPTLDDLPWTCEALARAMKVANKNVGTVSTWIGNAGIKLAKGTKGHELYIKDLQLIQKKGRLISKYRRRLESLIQQLKQRAAEASK